MSSKLATYRSEYREYSSTLFHNFDLFRFMHSMTCFMASSSTVLVNKSADLGRGRQAKVGPEVKWATPITANMVKAMAKIMMPVSSPSREGTMECVACEVQHKNKQ